MQRHRHRAAGPQRQDMRRPDPEAGGGLEAKGADDHREMDRQRLQCELVADADSRAHAERQVGKPVDALAPAGQETGRIETFRRLPQALVAVDDPGRDDDRRAGAEPLAIDLVGAEREELIVM